MYDRYYEQYEEPSLWPYYLIAFFAFVVISIVVAASLRNMLSKLSPEFVAIPPEQVWLIMIPLFGTCWMFYMIWHVSNGIKEEFKRRNIVEFETSPGSGIGWVFSFLFLTLQLVVFIDEHVVTLLLFVVTMILMTLYLVRLGNFRIKLDQTRSEPFEKFQQPGQWEQQHSPWPPYTPPPQNLDPPPPQYPPPSDQSQQNDWERWRPKQ